LNWFYGNNCFDIVFKKIGLAALASVSGTDFVVCSVADERCELGMLKKKLVAIVEYLKQPLTMSL